MHSSVSLSYRSLQQDRDDGLNIEALQVSVGLSRTHKHDGLACDVRHGDGRPHLQAGRERGSIIHVYSRGREMLYIGRVGGRGPSRQGERERLEPGGRCSGVPYRRRCQTW